MKLLDGRTVTIEPPQTEGIKRLVEQQITFNRKMAATDPKAAMLGICKALAPHIVGLNLDGLITHLLKYPDDTRRIASEILGREIPIITWQKVD